ncbi:MAG: hypothetical protein IJE07_14420 [Clostridia bacterium]|nr:hypothetical protein [Clostridia bacterium]
MAAENLKQNPAEATEELQDKELSIDLVELFFRLLEKAWLIILVSVLMGVMGGLYTHFFVEDTYSATTKLYVIGEDTAIDLTQLTFGDKLADDYVQVFYNRDVHRAVSDNLLNKYGYTLPDFERMQSLLDVTQLSNTRILKISFTCEDRDMALKVVKEYASAAISFIQARMGATVPPTEFEQPYASDKPVGPSMIRNVVLWFIAGCMIVCVTLVVIFIMDDRIRTTEQLERSLGLPTLGMMPLQKTQSRSRRKGEKA